MTKKDFIALADAFKYNRPLPSTGTERDEALWGMWRNLRRTVASVCVRDNSRFDEGRFVAWTEK